MESYEWIGVVGGVALFAMVSAYGAARARARRGIWQAVGAELGIGARSGERVVLAVDDVDLVQVEELPSTQVTSRRTKVMMFLAAPPPLGFRVIDAAADLYVASDEKELREYLHPRRREGLRALVAALPDAMIDGAVVTLLRDGYLDRKTIAEVLTALSAYARAMRTRADPYR